MRIPVVAIVGRPNVGKSTLFNRILRERRAVIEDIPGITRDRIYGEAEWGGKKFLVVDTGGFQRDAEEEITKEVQKQVLMTVEEADVVIMMMDVESGLLSSDVEFVEMLRRYNKKVLYVVNKVDGFRKEKMLYDFYDLGVDIFPLSALHGRGYETLMDKVSSMIPEVKVKEEQYPRIAIVGRPNVGKSTLVNSLLGKERMIVSPVPGTTRDAVDSICSYYKKKYVLIDTAGIRRKGKMAKTVEKYSFLRTLKNIEDSDVVLILLDASEGVVEVDQKIAGLVSSAKKPAIILYNKWDLVDTSSISVERIKEAIYSKLWFMRYVPILTISALSKRRVTKIFPLVDKIIEESRKRISTHELNMFLRDVLSKQEPPLYRGRKVKIYYITQVKTCPPGFVIFTNKKEGIKEQYIKFLENQLREHFSFMGVPVEFYVRQK